jgi:UDP-N-acetylmuramyl pentapeptide phosphotransferase/UDP-N-acetylglucosamine-1-phosphate transferase
MRREPREARAASGRGQYPPVRFWIITTMLVLVGLSTLKIR